MAWSKGQARGVAKRLRKDIGDRAWGLMTEETRAAFVDAAVLGIVCGQMAELVRVDDVTAFRMAVHQAAGLDTFVHPDPAPAEGS